MNFPEEPMTLMVPLQTPAKITEFVEEMHRVQSRLKVELGDRVSNFRVLNDPEIPGIYITCELAPLFTFTEED